MFSQICIWPPRGIVDEGVFEESTEDEEDADAGPDVDSFGVGDWGQAALDGAHGGGHGQQGGHPQGHPRRHRLVVQPEGEPWDEDNHEARDVDGQDVERKLSSNDNVDWKAAVCTWKYLEWQMTRTSQKNQEQLNV